MDLAKARVGPYHLEKYKFGTGLHKKVILLNTHGFKNKTYILDVFFYPSPSL